MNTLGILVLVSFGFITYGILNLLYQFSIIIRSVVVPGTVVGQWKQRVWYRGGSGTYTSGSWHTEVNVVVSFQPVGTAQVVTREIEAPLYAHPIGSQVQVIYLAGNLRSARIKEKKSLVKEAVRWIQPCLMIGLGLFIAFIFILGPVLGLLH